MYILLKRIGDLFVAFVLLLLVLPVLILVAISIKVDSKGAVFFRQLRVGEKGKHFLIYKFRTMKTGSRPLVSSDGSHVTVKDDQRVTGVGSLLRRWSLDELPQLINVLKGEMSLIGPRPDLPEHLIQYTKSNLKKLDVKPGITGLNQSLYRNSIEFKYRLKIDEIYVKNVSFMLDLKILINTIRIIIGGDGVNKTT